MKGKNIIEQIKKNKPKFYEGGITLNHINEAVEYIFNEPEKVKERKVKILRGCDTYGMYEFGEHCGDEKCEPCNKSIKEFNKLFKEEVERQLGEIELISGRVSMIDPDLGKRLYNKYVNKDRKL